MLPLYAGLARLAAPALRVMLRRRAARGKEIAARLPEREGTDPTPRPPGRLVWLHAASVGEVASIIPLLRDLAQQAPDATLLVTTGTVTSAQRLAQLLAPLGLGARVLHRFVPLDVPAWVARFVAHWRPDAAGFIESEIWPNLLTACRQADVPVMLINARLSARSFARWRRVAGAARQIIGGFTAIRAQSEADADRLRALGGRDVQAPGNLKFAAPPLPADAVELDRLRILLAGRPVWLAASTHPGEEILLAQVQASLAPAHPGLLCILVPRHPERGAAVAQDLAAWPVTRRALGQDAPDAAGFWIADTLGELGLWYRLVGHAFMGRSLVALGGQNPLEPARLGCAVAIGPHFFNFQDPVAALRATGGLDVVADIPALTHWVDTMLRDPARSTAIGQAAQTAARGSEGLPALLAADLLALTRSHR